MLPDYMEKQTDISGDMRAILVDWMVEVQVRGHSFLQSNPCAAFGMCDLCASRGSCKHSQCGAYPPPVWARDEPTSLPLSLAHRYPWPL